MYSHGTSFEFNLNNRGLLKCKEDLFFNYGKTDVDHKYVNKLSYNFDHNCPLYYLGFPPFKCSFT